MVSVEVPKVAGEWHVQRGLDGLGLENSLGIKSSFVFILGIHGSLLVASAQNGSLTTRSIATGHHDPTCQHNIFVKVELLWTISET